MTEQPHHGPFGHPPEIRKSPSCVDTAIAPPMDSISSQRAVTPKTSRRDPCSDHVDRGRPGLFGHAVVEADAREVDHLVHDVGDDDLAPQPVIEDRRAEALADRSREVANKVWLRYGSSASDVVETSAISAIFVYASRTANSGVVSLPRRRRGRRAASRSG